MRKKRFTPYSTRLDRPTMNPYRKGIAVAKESEKGQKPP